MSKNRRGIYYRALVSITSFLCLFIIFTSSSHSRTIVERTGQCSVRVTIKIEIWGDLASQAVVDRWKEKVESQWNGPTKETLENIAINDNALGTGEFGYNPVDPNLSPEDREKAIKENNDKMRIFQDDLLKKHKEMMDEMGMEGSNAIVNCCTITFVADIRMRDEDDDPTQDYHQIKVVEKYKEIEVAGKTVKKQVRSFVYMEEIDGEYVLNGQNNSTSGEWAFDPDPSSTERDASSHEVGHLMQLDDQYHDHDHDGDGEEESVDVPGQEANVMANNNGFPHEADLKSILDQAGIECDCCPNEEATDLFYMNMANTIGSMGNAIAACNLDQINQGIQDYTDQIKNMGQSRLPTATKLDLYRKLKAELDRLNKAKIDCGRPRPTTGTQTDNTDTAIGNDYGTVTLDDFGLGGKFGLGALGYTLGSDSTDFCTYGDGNIEPPTMTIIEPDEPATTPDSTPGSTPGATPETTPTVVPDGGSIFADGFENGDTTRWTFGGSETTPGSTPTLRYDLPVNGGNTVTPTLDVENGPCIGPDCPPDGTIQGPGVITDEPSIFFTPKDTTPAETPTITYELGGREFVIPITPLNPEEEETEETPEEIEEEKPITATPVVTYHVKTKDSVLQSDGTKLSQDMGGQRIKLIDPSLQSPKLAMNDSAKEDNGYSAGPTQCTTNDLGECDINIDLREIIKQLPGIVEADPNATPGTANITLRNPNLTGTPSLAGTPATTGTPQTDGLTGLDPTAYGLNPDGTIPVAEVQIEVGSNKVNSDNMIVPNDEVDSLPQEVIDTATTKLTIGDNTYLTYTSGYDYGDGYNWGLELKGKYDLSYEIEENKCGDEQPGPPMGTFIDTLGLANGNNIPNTKISIPLGGIQ